MTTLNFPDTVWRALEWGGKNPPPLINRIDQCAVRYLERTGDQPNVVLLRAADLAEAEDSYHVPLPNGKTAHIAVEASPFPGTERVILVGRKEIVSP